MSETLTCTAPAGPDNSACGQPAVEILLTRPAPEMVRNAAINAWPRCGEHPAAKEVAAVTHYDPGVQWVIFSLLPGNPPFAVGGAYTAQLAS